MKNLYIIQIEFKTSYDGDKKIFFAGKNDGSICEQIKNFRVYKTKMGAEKYAAKWLNHFYFKLSAKVLTVYPNSDLFNKICTAQKI